MARVAQAKRWIPLKQAAAQLGVDEGTLRHWADLGKVRAFRTPGGHRRFLEEDLRALMAPDASGDVAAAIQHGRILAGQAGRRLQAAEWFDSVGEAFRQAARERGHQLLDLLGRAARGEHVLDQVRSLGREYGAELRRGGLTLLQATETFCLFRDSVLTRATRSGEGQIRVFCEMSRLMDEVLLGVVRAYEERPA